MEQNEKRTEQKENGTKRERKGEQLFGFKNRPLVSKRNQRIKNKPTYQKQTVGKF